LDTAPPPGAACAVAPADPENRLAKRLGVPGSAAFGVDADEQPAKTTAAASKAAQQGCVPAYRIEFTEVANRSYIS
jgi:hypothetical protein